MKIIIIDNNRPTTDNNNGNTTLCENRPVVYALPDTALLRDNRPFFVPDFTRRCSRRLALVVRISRLGRCISERFARRYYDAVTVGVCFAAEDLRDECRHEGLPWSLCCGFDGATALGRFIPIEEAGGDITACHLQLRQDGIVTEEVDTATLPFCAERLIAYISRYYTLRQGDLLFLGTWGEGREAVIDSRLTATLNGRELLAFNVK